MIKSLHAKGVRVVAHDARAMKAALREAGDFFEPVATADECVLISPVVVLLSCDSAHISAIVGYRGQNEKVVVDCWRALDGQAVGPTVKIVKFGFFDKARQGR